MYIAEKVVSAPCDFNSRFVANFVHSILEMKSFPYIATLDKIVNAKSILGLLSADIKKTDDICLQVLDNYSQEEAEKCLAKLIKAIFGDV
jgi:phosphotransferase system HPr-like phosphotransfer protein